QRDTPLKRVYALTTDDQGDLWIADIDQGIFRWSHGQLSAYRPASTYIRGPSSLATDGSGRIWVGFDGAKLGVIEQDGSFHQYGPAEGPGRYDTAVHVDRAGDVWFGGVYGLARLANGRLTSVGGRNGFPKHETN